MDEPVESQLQLQNIDGKSGGKNRGKEHHCNLVKEIPDNIGSIL